MKSLLRLLTRALREYRLIDDGDHVLVALSGGKDSLCLLELLAQRRHIYPPRFQLSAVHVRMENVAYETNTTYLEDICLRLDVPLHILTTRFEESPDKPPCFLCSWNRRKLIFNLAQELGCQKIALGHHQDDILHTALMNLTFQGRFDSMPPKLQMEKMPLSIIRPLCLCHEADIQVFADAQGYLPQKKRCPYEHETHRTSMRDLFHQLEQLNPDVRHSIWHALERDSKPQTDPYL